MTTIVFKTYLDPDLAVQVSRLAQAQGRSDSAWIADAIRMRLSTTTEDAIRAEEESIKRKLSRLERRVDKSVWEIRQTKELLLVFVRVWLEYNPQLDTEQEKSAAASADARFARLLDFVSKALRSGRSFGDLEDSFDGSLSGEGRDFEVEARS